MLTFYKFIDKTPILSQLRNNFEYFIIFEFCLMLIFIIGRLIYQYKHDLKINKIKDKRYSILDKYTNDKTNLTSEEYDFLYNSSSNPTNAIFSDDISINKAIIIFFKLISLYALIGAGSGILLFIASSFIAYFIYVKIYYNVLWEAILPLVLIITPLILGYKRNKPQWLKLLLMIVFYLGIILAIFFILFY